jgi:hypothetical protein
VEVDALSVRLRPRTPMEAADLGVRLCQSVARPVYLCYGLVAVPFMALALASFEIATWLPALVIWLGKPWLDRTILFVLARAAFGQRTTPANLWQAQRQLWWGQLLHTFTMRRLSPWRSFTQPVYQLEGVSPWRARKRVLQIRARKSGQAFLMTLAFGMAEFALLMGLVSLVFWFAPTGQAPDFSTFLTGEEDASVFAELVSAIGYAVVVLFLEPFYVAAGFAMYLNRRAELEAWDIEQEFRRAFAQ